MIVGAPDELIVTSAGNSNILVLDIRRLHTHT